MVARYLANRLVDSVVILALLTAIFEGPTIIAIARHKLKGA